MITKIKNFITSKKLLEKNSRVLVGLSGGPDSVFLLHALNQLKNELKLELIAAHLNHEWRESAKIDEQFCIDLCQSLNVPIITKKASELKFKPKERGSKEDIGRQLRRFFFESILTELNFELVALAHHLDDQEENFFIRLIRGTSLSGLAGIKAKDSAYIRPLLEVTKQEILDYLQKDKLKFITDPTNISADYLRNRIRKIIPQLKECDERFDKNFLSTLYKLQSADNFIKKTVQDKLIEINIRTPQITLACPEPVEGLRRGEWGGIDIKKLLALDTFLQKQIIVEWLILSKVEFELTENFINEILKFFKSEHGGKHILGNWFIEKKQNYGSIGKINESSRLG